MSTTREKIRNILLERHRCTLNELAEALGKNPISVRHHVSKLEEAGEITSEEEIHGVGRPRLVYFLTHTGMEQFPQRYLTLSKRILEQLKGNLPAKTVSKLFKQIAADMVDDHTTQFDLSELELSERITLISRLLQNEGFKIEVSTKEEGFQIKETSCPYKHVGEEHPEVCLVDETIIEKVLATPITKTHCVLDGDPYCAYLARTSSQTQIIIPE
jgi:predicted ArsR family transcriptional regulator